MIAFFLTKGVGTWGLVFVLVEVEADDEETVDDHESGPAKVIGRALHRTTRHTLACQSSRV